MLPHTRIPGHITALYIFAILNLMALFHITLVEANIVVLDSGHSNETIADLFDLPAKFGPPIPMEGVWGHMMYARPANGCVPMERPPPATNTSLGWIVVIKRHGCDFDKKVFNAENAGFIAAIVHNVGNDKLLPMGSGSVLGVNIPSAFIGETDGLYLKNSFDKRTDFIMILDSRVPMNANLYLLPFAIVVGICFVLMLVFMLVKWIRDFRRRRRSRLSKTNLKKIPIKKFKKGDRYDVCAICLDEYEEGEKLRILPCEHAYHMKCIDPWLTKNKKTCPVCKRKVVPGEDSSSDSDSDDDGGNTNERTPLLASGGSDNATQGAGIDNAGADAAADYTVISSDDDDMTSVPSPGTSQGHSISAQVHSCSPGTSYGAIPKVHAVGTRRSPQLGSSPGSAHSAPGMFGRSPSGSSLTRNSPSASQGRTTPGSYGATAQLVLTDETCQEGEEPTEILGAVGGGEELPIVDDHYQALDSDDAPMEREMKSLLGESTDPEAIATRVAPKKKGKKKKSRKNKNNTIA